MKQGISFCSFSGEARGEDQAESTNGKARRVLDENSYEELPPPATVAPSMLTLKKLARGAVQWSRAGGGGGRWEMRVLSINKIQESSFS